MAKRDRLRKGDAQKYWVTWAIIGAILWPLRGFIASQLSHAGQPGAALLPGPNMSPGERIWEVPYDKVTESWNAWMGDKPWPPSILALATPTIVLEHIMHPTTAGRIVFRGSNTTRQARGHCGQWTPPAGTIYTAGGKPTIAIGDPRALYCLDKLCSAGSITHLDTFGIYNWNPANGFWGHDDGCAVDVTGPDFGDASMNRFVHAAITLNMPIAWIGRRDAGPWPIFAIKNGKKVQVGTTNVPHKNHYHLVLPRPQWALGFMFHYTNN